MKKLLILLFCYNFTQCMQMEFGANVERTNKAIYDRYKFDQTHDHNYKEIVKEEQYPGYTFGIHQEARLLNLDQINILLLSGDSRINDPDLDGNTVLHIVIFRIGNTLHHNPQADIAREIDLIRSLIDRGADINIVNKFGCSPVDYGRVIQNQELHQLLGIASDFAQERDTESSSKKSNLVLSLLKKRSVQQFLIGSVVTLVCGAIIVKIIKARNKQNQKTHI